MTSATVKDKAYENPFYPQAVATYGQVLRTCTFLKYMQTPLKELNDYLIAYPKSMAPTNELTDDAVAYPKSTQQYGATIGLSGGHGSGKTHLLNWLSQSALERQEIKPIVLYAKADRASFFDLYTQLLGGLPTVSMQLLLNQALISIAFDLVQKASATASVKDRLRTAEDLQSLYREGNLNEGQLTLELQTRLLAKLNIKLEESARIPTDIPLTLMKVISPTQGSSAYQWLLGSDVSDLKDLGLRQRLLQVAPQQTDSAGPDTTAINALETIAALASLAERPLIILIDQLEVLLREPGRQEVMFSVIKKMIEQLGQQKVLTFIAGSAESWDMLPRDVPPRLRLRRPLPVGNLDLGETGAFLNAYTKELPSAFSGEAVERIQELSGGNPREIIRIAYYAYERSEGRLDAVDQQVLVESAGKSGSISDLTGLALKQSDAVLGKLGSVLKDYDIGNGTLIDRLLEVDGQPRIALASVTATDRLSEIDSARRIRSIREYIENTWPAMPLIVATIGYSSSEIIELLGTTSTFLQYREATFINQLQTKVTELWAKQRAEISSSSQSDPAVLDLLKSISSRLNGLEIERSESVKQIAERFDKSVRIKTEPDRKEHELQTRWDLLEELDNLQMLLQSGKPRSERELLRSILIANEAHLKIKRLDYLGGLYLDVLSEVDSAESAYSRRPPEVNSRNPVEILFDYRRDFIGELRRVLRGPSFIDKWMDNPWRYGLICSLVVSVIGLLLYLVYPNNILIYSRYYDMYGKEPPAYWWFWPLIVQRFIPLLLATTAVVTGSTLLMSWRHRQRWERKVRHARWLSRESGRRT